MYCSKCGKEVQKGEKFCPQCGNTIEADQSKKNTSIDNKPQSEEKKHKSWKAGVLLIILLVIGVGGILLYHQMDLARKDAMAVNNQDAGAGDKSSVDTADAESFDTEYLAYVIGEDEKYGYINEEGKEIISCQYDMAYDFEENGLAKVGRKVGEDEIGKPVYIYGYINEMGEQVISCQYDETGTFGNNGLAMIEKDEKWGYINEKGEEIIPCQYDEISEFGENGLAPVKKDEKWGYVNENGEEVMTCQYEWAETFDSNGLAIVKKAGKYGYINEKGEEVIECQYDRAKGFGSNGLAFVSKSGKYGYINQEGEEVIECQYEGAHEFGCSNLVSVKKNGRWGYIDEEGEEIIPFQYSEASAFSKNGLAAVCKNGKYGCINKDGEVVVPFEYSNMMVCGVNDYLQYEMWNEELGIYEYCSINVENFGSNIMVSQDGKIGLVSENGEEIIPCEYALFSEADEKGFFVGYKQYSPSEYVLTEDADGKGKVYKEYSEGKGLTPVLLTVEGEIIVPERYDDIGTYGKNDLAFVSDGGICKYIDRTGKVVMELSEKHVEAGKFVKVR